ncbi:MAG: hypothetical protein ACKON9_26570, partial [Planctomycetaceae bacterium]
PAPSWSAALPHPTHQHQQYPRPDKQPSLPGGSGRARLDDSAGTAGVAAATAVYPGAGTAGAGESGEAVLQTMKGPALAGFLRTGRTPDGKAGAAVIGDSGVGVRARTGGGAEQTSFELPRSAALSRPSPAAEAAALTTGSAEVDGFSSFLARDGGSKAAPASTAAAKANSAATVEDFSEFASRRQSEWKQKPTGSSGVVQASAVADSASSAGTRSERMKTLPKQSASSASELNPFEDLPAFDTVDGAAEQRSGAATGSDVTLGGDADWKPAEFQP